MPKTKDKIRLLLPSPEMKNQVMAFRAAFLENGEEWIHGSFALGIFDDFERWFAAQRASHMGQEVGGQHPSSTFFAMRTKDQKIIGVANIRHFLTDETYHNGHISYSVLPEERNKGYGTEILRLALIKAGEMGIIEPVVSHDKGNRASRKVIIRNGFSFRSEYTRDNGKTLCIYVRD